jgi:hypothetical protein
MTDHDRGAGSYVNNRWDRGAVVMDFLFGTAPGVVTDTNQQRPVGQQQVIDPEARYAAARANLMLCQNAYNQAVSMLIQAERECRDAMHGARYSTMLATSGLMNQSPPKSVNNDK